MKGFIYGTLMAAGFIIGMSESDSTVAQNFIGLAVFTYSAYKLGWFYFQKNRKNSINK